MTHEKQEKTFRHDGVDEDGNPFTIIAAVRHDDRCNNGHNTFAITGELYEKHTQPGEPSLKHKGTDCKLWLSACGCMHDGIARHFPDLAPLVKWHLCSTDGPLHYIENTTFHAGDLDCWGLRKGEPKLKADGTAIWHSEGKDRDLARARCCAIWPDATDEDLTALGLEQRLKERLPALMQEFRAAVESLGLEYGD